MSKLQIAIVDDEQIQYTTDYIQIMTNIESEQPIASQSKPHGNADPRINSIFLSIQNAAIPVTYMCLTTSEVKSQIARQSDDESLWQSVQVRSDKSMDSRQQDEDVKDRISEIVHKSKLGQWGDFDNPPMGFCYDGKLWFLLGNGRVASIVGAAEELEKELFFQVMLLDLESTFNNKQDLEDWCAAIAKKSNNKTKNDVKEETFDEKISHAKDYWERILRNANMENLNPVVREQYNQGINLFLLMKSKNKSLKDIREHVITQYLQREKNIYDARTIGLVLSKAFDDQKQNTARFYDPGESFAELIPKIWDKYVTDACCFSQTDSGFHKNTFDPTGKQCYLITTSIDRHDQIIFQLMKSMMQGEELEISIIIDPYSRKSSGARRSDTRQSNIVGFLKDLTKIINTSPTMINGKGGIGKRVIFPREMDSSGTDKEGNYDCDIVYQWNNQCWVRIDNGEFGRQDKLKSKLHDPNETVEES